MVVVFRLLLIAQATDGLDHVILRIALPRIDHVINGVHAAKTGMLRLARFCRNPYLVIVRISIEMFVAEVATKQAKLPQVIGNVFAHIGHCAIGADNDFGIFVGAFRLLLRRLAAGAPHHPAAFVLAFRLEVKHAFLLHLLKSQVPEMQMENLALARQEVILNAEALHGFEMPPQNRRRDNLAYLRRLVSALLDLMQNLQANFRVLFVLFIPLRDAGVEVPAVVIKRTGRIMDQPLDLSFSFFLQVDEACDYLLNLTASIVNVVLHIYMRA